MPDSRPLIDLQQRLQSALSPRGALEAPVWGQPRVMTEAMRNVEQAFDTMGASPNTASIRKAVLAFARRGSAESFTELKYVCYGVALPIDDDRRRLIDSSSKLQQVLRAVDEQTREPRRFRRCYQALLQSYFAFDTVEDATVAKAAAGSFKTLRGYLSDNLSVIAKPIGGRAAPGWVITLREHRNLLSEQPCDRYVADLRKGKTDHLAQVCEGLGITRESWVWQEVILAYLRDVCSREDGPFKGAMDNAMDLASGRLDLRPNAGTAREIMAALVRRYEKVSPHPEHPRLRDLSVEHIGNPWLKRAAWDAWVKHEPARKMVDSWLKTRLIRDFFELLSQDGAAEQRRLDYWLRFESVIDDMWFVLGDDAQRNRSPAFKELRNRMAGRDRLLEGAPPENNAFVMKIGSLYLIEFGVTGNACFVIPTSTFKADLDRRVLNMRLDLKQKGDGVRRLSHMGSWEARFDEEICPLIGFRPGSARARVSARAAGRPFSSDPLPRAPVLNPPARERQADAGDLQGLLDVCRAQGIRVEDLRPKGGSLWVMAVPGKNSGIVVSLLRMGFRYKERRGYWLAKDD